MSGFVLDTSVLSAFAPGRDGVDPGVVAWFDARRERCHVSVVTLAEIIQGIAKLRRTDRPARADAFQSWLDGIVADFADRLLSLDKATARVLGHMSDAAYAIGRHPGFTDVAIAATAKAGGHVLLTRNIKHFAPLGIEIHDPFAPAAP